MDHQVYGPLSVRATTTTTTIATTTTTAATTATATTRAITYLGKEDSKEERENSAEGHDYEEQDQVFDVNGYPLDAHDESGKGHGIILGW